MDTSTDATASPIGSYAASFGSFIRAFPHFGSRLAWFLGAGTSVASDIPTAWQLIQRFRIEIYCTDNKFDPNYLDLNDPAFKARVDLYFKDRVGCPDVNAIDSYARYFELAYPDDGIRQDVIYGLMADKKPNYGHHVMAALSAIDLLPIIFQVNFDDLPNQALRALLDSDFVEKRRPVHSISLHGTTGDAIDALNKQRWPVEIGLHGDFRFKLMKNTETELKAQDEELRNTFLETCTRFGMAVVGYSGRDTSIMDVLREAIQRPKSFPEGLFWFHQPNGVSKEAADLLAFAQQHSVKTEAIEVESFIELFAGIQRGVEFPPKIQGYLDGLHGPEMHADAPLPSGPMAQWPVLRLNALPLIGIPNHARLLKGRASLRDAQKALRQSRARALIAEREGELLALGNDEELNKALFPLGVEATDKLVPILEQQTTDSGRLVYRSTDIGLAIDALTIGLGRAAGLAHVLRFGPTHAVRVRDESETTLQRLRSACGGHLTGSIPRSSLKWSEAVGITMEYRDDSWWLLFAPEIWVSRLGDPPEALQGNTSAIEGWKRSQLLAASDFVRERSAQRYNSKAAIILDAWVGVLTLGQDSRELRTWNLSEHEGIDGLFSIGSKTAFCRALQIPGVGAISQ